MNKPNISRIAIAGAGGIGAFLAANLFDYGAKRSQFDFGGSSIHIFDNDNVDASNLLHQNFYDEDIGEYKANIVAKRCLDMVIPQLKFMETADFPNYDVIFSAVDSMKFRKQLYEYGFDHPEQFWIDGRCSSRRIGLYHSRMSKDELKKVISESEERTGCLLDYDKKNKTSHVTPQIVAAKMTQVFLNYLRSEDDLYLASPQEMI